jgi:hypothetical protein
MREILRSNDWWREIFRVEYLRIGVQVRTSHFHLHDTRLASTCTFFHFIDRCTEKDVLADTLFVGDISPTYPKAVGDSPYLGLGGSPYTGFFVDSNMCRMDVWEVRGGKVLIKCIVVKSDWSEFAEVPRPHSYYLRATRPREAPLMSVRK